MQEHLSTRLRWADGYAGSGTRNAWYRCLPCQSELPQVIAHEFTSVNVRPAAAAVDAQQTVILMCPYMNAGCTLFCDAHAVLV
jgi:hypothetical protein